MFCNNCGSRIDRNSKFCKNCGQSLAVDIDGETKTPQNAFIDTELKKVEYKIENDDLVGAENILENLAIEHGLPIAWIYIGAIKMGQLGTGKTTVQQALNCFIRASELEPSRKEEYQSTYCDLSLQQIEKFRNFYFVTKKQAKKAKSSKRWNAVLVGLSVGLGNQHSNNGNNAFRGTAGVAGAAYAINQISKKSTQYQEAGDFLLFVDKTMRQLIAGANSFCSNNQSLYKSFSESLSQILSDDSFDHLRKMVVSRKTSEGAVNVQPQKEEVSSGSGWLWALVLIIGFIIAVVIVSSYANGSPSSPTNPPYAPQSPPAAITPPAQPPTTLSNDQICQNQYGTNSDWAGTTDSQGRLVCGCVSGYTWNTGNTACVTESGY